MADVNISVALDSKGAEQSAKNLDGNKSLSSALEEMRRDDPSFYWRLRYLDRPFTRALIDEMNRIAEKT